MTRWQLPWNICLPIKRSHRFENLGRTDLPGNLRRPSGVPQYDCRPLQVCHWQVGATPRLGTRTETLTEFSSNQQHFSDRPRLLNVNDTHFRTDDGDSRSLEELLRRVGEQSMPILKRRRSVLRQIDAEIERHHRTRTALSGLLTLVCLVVAGLGVQAEIASRATSSSSISAQLEPSQTWGLKLKVGDRTMTCSSEGIGTWEHVELLSEQRDELVSKMGRG